ncbi:DnaB-like helicase C-terminal domain-containing protein [Streptomyces albidoflavus]
MSSDEPQNANSTAGADYSLIGEGEHFKQHLREIRERSTSAGKLLGLPTGFAELDPLLHGLRPGHFIVIAGRSSVGKSTLAMDFIRACAVGKRRTPVGLFSLEMGRQEITQRLISATSSVDLRRIRGGDMRDEDWGRVDRRSGDVKNAPIYLDTSPNLTLMDIQAKARRLVQHHGVQLLVIDHLRLVKLSGSTETWLEQAPEMIRSLKVLAKDLKVPVVATFGLGYGPNRHEGSIPPGLHHLDVAAIEQHADTVILLHREDLDDQESPRAGEADLIVAKNRHGATATITVAFQGPYSRFTDMEHG